jgi:hypothetical protein
MKQRGDKEEGKQAQRLRTMAASRTWFGTLLPYLDLMTDRIL